MEWSKYNNARNLDLSSDDPSYKSLEIYLKNIEITVQTPGRRPRVRKIRSLVPRAGYVLFEKNGIQTTVAVYNPFLSTILYEKLTFLLKAHFREAYGFNVRFPNIIGVNLAGRKSLRQEVVPIELCHALVGLFLYKGE
jgi:hypothetical protein